MSDNQSNPIKGWVKASERLPDTVEFYLIYKDKNGKPDTMYVSWNTKFYADDDFYEWLDETIQLGEERLLADKDVADYVRRLNEENRKLSAENTYLSDGYAVSELKQEIKEFAQWAIENAYKAPGYTKDSFFYKLKSDGSKDVVYRIDDLYEVYRSNPSLLSSEQKVNKEK